MAYSNPTATSLTKPIKFKSKEYTVDKLFADLVLAAPKSGFIGPWAVSAEHTADAGCAYRWGEHCWEFVHSEEGRSLAAKWLDKAHPDRASSDKAKQAWNFACDRLRQEKPFTAGDYGHMNVIPTLSGYLSLLDDGTIEVLKADPIYGIAYVIEAQLSHASIDSYYQPQPVPPESLFGRYLAASLPDLDVRDVVQELCGQTLLPTNYGVAAWFFGQGANGKGVLMEVIEAIHRQSCRLRLDHLAEKFALEPLIGASLVLVDEVANGKFDEELYKTLITGNGVDIDRKYDKALRSYHSRAKFIISANTIPHIRDKTDGVWRRSIFIPWQVQIAECDRIPDLDKLIIKNELHIVLDWLLMGAVRIVQRGRFLSETEMPQIIQSQKQIMRLESDSVRAWIDEEGIHHSAVVWTANDEIYKSYDDWCESAQRTPLGVEMFWKTVRNRFPEIETKQSRVKINGKPARKRVSNLSLVPPVAVGQEPTPAYTGCIPLTEIDSLDDLSTFFG
jgi:P4 family phage/plasmid primase-like protien